MPDGKRHVDQKTRGEEVELARRNTKLEEIREIGMGFDCSTF